MKQKKGEIKAWFSIRGRVKNGVSSRLNNKLNLLFERKHMLTKGSTPAEESMKIILNSLNVTYEFQYPFLTHKSFYITDFLIKGYRLIIEVDGRHHYNTSQEKYDLERTKQLEKRGFKVIRFSNTEVLSNTEKVRNRILSEINTYIEILVKKNILKQSNSIGTVTPIP